VNQTAVLLVVGGPWRHVGIHFSAFITHLLFEGTQKVAQVLGTGVTFTELQVATLNLIQKMTVFVEELVVGRLHFTEL